MCINVYVYIYIIQKPPNLTCCLVAGPHATGWGGTLPASQMHLRWRSGDPRSLHIYGVCLGILFLSFILKHDVETRSRGLAARCMQLCVYGCLAFNRKRARRKMQESCKGGESDRTPQKRTPPPPQIRGRDGSRNRQVSTRSDGDVIAEVIRPRVNVNRTQNSLVYREAVRASVFWCFSCTSILQELTLAWCPQHLKL